MKFLLVFISLVIIILFSSCTENTETNKNKWTVCTDSIDKKSKSVVITNLEIHENKTDTINWAEITLKNGGDTSKEKVTTIVHSDSLRKWERIDSIAASKNR